MFNISYLFTYIRITFCVDRIHRMLRPFVLPPRFFRDGAAVYVFICRRSPGFYVGMTTSFFSRVMGHIRDVRALARLKIRSRNPDGVFHAHVLRTGLGNFSVLLLVIFPCPDLREARMLARASIRRMESWFICNLCRTHARTLNIVGTWRRSAEFSRYHMFGTPVAPFDERAPHTAGFTVPTCSSTSFVQFIVSIGGARVRCFDLYTVLSSLSQLPARSDRRTLATILVITGNLHVTRFRALRLVFGASILRLHKDGQVSTVLGSDLRRSAMDAHRLDVITATRRQSETPFHTRHNLARLLYDKTFARAFERTCTLVQLHHLYTACKRLQHHRQAARRGRIVTICRRKFGLHPGLALTIKIRTPLRATRRQLLDSARAAIKSHSDLPPHVNTIICRNLRIVFSRGRRVIDYFDNVRQHCEGYIAGTVRECTCKNLTQYWRHPSTGCVAFTSSDYNGAFADVLHQNCRTVCSPARTPRSKN